jgi:AcrR family transcriptional regulator
MEEMATAPQKRLPRAERRELILESAGRLFGERGYVHTSLDEIAAAAGVTKPVLYRHFDSKKDLYLALLERHRDELPRFFERVPPDDARVLRGGAEEQPVLWDQRVGAILEAWFDYVSEHGYAWRMIFRDSGGGPEIDEFRRGNQDRAREVLAGFIAGQKGIPKAQVEPLAEFLRAGGAGLALWSLDHPEITRATLVATARRVLGAVAGTD